MNKTLALCMTAVVASSLSACGTVKQLAQYDLTETGGIGGHYESAYLMKASTHEMVLFRASEMYAILADSGTITVQNPTDEEYFVRQIVQTNQDINFAKKMIATPCPNGANNMVDGCAQLIERYNIKIEGDLLSMAKFALPTDKLRTFLSATSSGNILGSLQSASAAVGQLLVEFHEGAATDRVGVELVMQYQTGSASKPATFDDARKAYVQAGAAVGAFTPDATALNAMYNIAYTACNSIVKRMPNANTAHVTDILNSAAGGPQTCKMEAAS